MGRLRGDWTIGKVDPGDDFRAKERLRAAGLGLDRGHPHKQNGEEWDSWAMRTRLPDRRRTETIERDSPFGRVTASIGLDSQGMPKEIFLSAAKSYSDIDIILKDTAVTISVALQSGILASALAKSIAREPEELDGPPIAPASIIGWALDLLVEYEKGSSK